MPISKKRSGNFFAKCMLIVDFDKSASRQTISGYFSPSLASVSPKAARVAIGLTVVLIIVPSVDQGDRLVELLLIWCRAVPCVFAFFHEPYAFALESIGHDHGG